MKAKLHLLGFIIIFAITLMAGLKSASALDTVVVGQPYYYYNAPLGYGPYAPIAYPGLYPGYDNPNPAARAGFASSPFFLGNRATGPAVNRANRAASYLFYGPAFGQGVSAY